MDDSTRRFIAEAKAHLRGLSDVKSAFDDVRGAMLREVDEIATSAASGGPVIPEISYDAIASDRVSDATRAEIRHRGCAVVRGGIRPCHGVGLE